MTHSAKIICDSLSPIGHRLTTMEVCFPRIVLAEFNTHRMFSRNSASSRAIPIEKMIRMVNENPYIPTHWGQNQKGMQAELEVDPETANRAKQHWLTARDLAIAQAFRLLDLGIHKQITNRLLEPFMFHTCIVSATTWDNFFHLRCHPAAHPEIKLVAELMRSALERSMPEKVEDGDWHMPYIKSDDYVELYDKDPKDQHESLKKISVARCARVSYLTHDGKRDIQADIDMYDNKLVSSGHMSPLEHVATPHATGRGNFDGWLQLRKTIPFEHDILRGDK